MNKKLVLIVGLVITFLIGVVAGATMVGVINISYIIEPTTSEAVTLNPNTVSLELGTIPSDSVGEIDFGNCCRLSLSAGYRLKFELVESTLNDFSYVDVCIRIYEAGTTNEVGYVPLFQRDWMLVSYETLDAGDYDLHIEVEYQATHVTETTTGEVEISISY